MGLSTYLQRIGIFLMGCFTFLILREFQDNNSNVSLTARITLPETKTGTVPTSNVNEHDKILKRKIQTSKTDDFTQIYVKSVFCNKRKKPVPLILSSALRVPNDKLLYGKEVIVLVISSPDHSDLRRAIRKTWANSTSYQVGVIFVVGIPSGLRLSSLITLEHNQYGDILQLNTPDSYRNLPEKILSAFTWVLDSVKGVKHIVKSDDDVYLYLPSLISTIKMERRDVIIGAYNGHSVVSRNSQDDWGVSKDTYPPSYFPPYVSGGSYVMSVSVVKKLMESLNSCRRLHIEDVFITGILAMASEVDHQSHSGFSFWTSHKAHGCDLIKGRVNSVNMSVKQLYTLHHEVLNNSMCSV